MKYIGPIVMSIKQDLMDSQVGIHNFLPSTASLAGMILLQKLLFDYDNIGQGNEYLSN